MGTIERKKEVMQVAKKNLMFFVLILIWSYSHAQNITGEFQRIDPLTAARDLGVQFSFKENLEFERATYEHLGIQEQSHGSYEILKIRSSSSMKTIKNLSETL